MGLRDPRCPTCREMIFEIAPGLLELRAASEYYSEFDESLAESDEAYTPPLSNPSFDIDGDVSPSGYRAAAEEFVEEIHNRQPPTITVDETWRAHDMQNDSLSPWRQLIAELNVAAAIENAAETHTEEAEERFLRAQEEADAAWADRDSVRDGVGANKNDFQKFLSDVIAVSRQKRKIFLSFDAFAEYVDQICFCL